MRILAPFLLSTLLTAAGVHAAPPVAPADARPALLQALDGHWIMSGDVRGKPVQYHMDALPTLNGTFTEMHMLDTQVPAKYEARVFIGYDPGSQSVIAHWLDSFGAKSSIPHATGHIADSAIEFTFPYASAPFRDTLRYHAQTASWTLEIESAKPDGTWQHFARYDIRHPQ
jgi:hypothetical protein